MQRHAINLGFTITLLCSSWCWSHDVSSNAAPHATRVTIPAGSFQLGCSQGDLNCHDDEGQPGGVKVHVPEFSIDTQETSVAEYRQCVTEKQCERPFTFRKVHYCNYDAPGRDNYPLNCVNWQQAYQYCQWKGGRLAYEAEWEKAARAGTSTRYFWGNESADCTKAVMDNGKPGRPDHLTDGCWRDLSWPRNSFPS